MLSASPAWPGNHALTLLEILARRGDSGHPLWKPEFSPYIVTASSFEFRGSPLFSYVITAMSIVDEIMKQVGVSKEQAEGGLGLIFKLAKDKLGADFSQVSNVVPDANTLIGKAPPPSEAEGGGGLMGMLGGMASKMGLGDIGKLAELAAQFKKLGLDMETVQKYVKVVMTFVESKGGTVVKDLLNKVLSSK